MTLVEVMPVVGLITVSYILDVWMPVRSGLILSRITKIGFETCLIVLTTLCMLVRVHRTAGQDSFRQLSCLRFSVYVSVFFVSSSYK